LMREINPLAGQIEFSAGFVEKISCVVVLVGEK